MKKILIIIILIFSSSISFAQKEEQLTQEKFAVELVKNMKLYRQLPLAALPSDCVNLLESLGISPLGGWDRKALLAEDDFTVLIAKAVGKEQLVHIKAAEFCHRKIDFINDTWTENPDLSLSELFTNKELFPTGSPQCPYGLKYEDKDNNRQVDQHYHPVVYFKQ